MLHLLNNTGLRTFTLCMSVGKKGLSTASPLTNLSLQAGPWVCPGPRSPQGGECFQITLPKIWKRWRQHTCTGRSLLLHRKSWAGSDRHVRWVCPQDTSTRAQLGADQLFGCGVGCHVLTVLELLIALSFRGHETIPSFPTAVHKRPFTENIWKHSLCLLHRILSDILKISCLTVRAHKT